VIFVTAYDSYAIRAFDVHAVDYLLKPFSAERLSEALDRARARMRSASDVAQGFSPAVSPVDLLASSRRQRGPLERILIRDRGDVHVVPVGKIDYIEAQDDYVAVKALGKSFLKEQTLADLETLLDGTRFVRIHRRYILNVARLAKIEQSITESRVAVLADGTELPISKTGYARLKELL
jgi:two-component system LytT family response regulator